MGFRHAQRVVFRVVWWYKYHNCTSASKLDKKQEKMGTRYVFMIGILDQGSVRIQK